MKNILVTGGAGYIGSIISELLLADGYNVTCIDRFYFGYDSIQSFSSNDKYNYIQKDIRTLDEDDFKNINIVIDLAGISNDPACDLDENLTEEINHKGTLNVATKAKSAGVNKYIMASSCSIYGASDGKPLNEKSGKRPVSLYAKSKIDSEKDIIELASKDYSVTFLRLSTVFGLSYRMRFDLIINIMTMYAYTKNKILVLGGGKQWRPLVHVKDVARAFQLVVQSKNELINGEAFNVGSNDQNFQVWQVANIIKNTLPREIEIDLVPDDPDKRNYNVSFDKINKQLGYKTKYSIEYGINEVYDALLKGKIRSDDIKTITVKYYKYLIDADDKLQKLKINGKLF